MSESTLQSNEIPLSEGGNSALSGQDTVSDSVARALSTALQKIEAYVPTQWVDNTEPDIDAAHLNHAEQAIMRVTNLMNGAVDVINSLSTQVDELNGNMNNCISKIIIDDRDSSVNSDPYATIKKHWNEVPKGVCIATVWCGPVYCATIIKVGDGFGAAYIISYALESPIFVRYINYEWT